IVAPRLARPADEAALLSAIDGTNNAAEIVALCGKLGLIGSERAVPALARLADDARGGVAEAALARLAGHARGGRAEAAGAALGKIGGDDATELLVSYVERSRPRVMRAAVAALGVAGTPRAIEALARLARTPRAALREEAVAALAVTGAPETIDVYRALLGK